MTEKDWIKLSIMGRMRRNQKEKESGNGSQVSFIDNKGCIFWDCTNEANWKIATIHPTFNDTDELFRVCFEHIPKIKQVCEKG